MAKGEHSLQPHTICTLSTDSVLTLVVLKFTVMR